MLLFFSQYHVTAQDNRLFYYLWVWQAIHLYIQDFDNKIKIPNYSIRGGFSRNVKIACFERTTKQKQTLSNLYNLNAQIWS